MDKQKIKLFSYFLIGLTTVFLIMYAYKNYTIEKKETKSENAGVVTDSKNIEVAEANTSGEIDQLTKAETVINYVKSNNRLPDFYLTKSEAKKLGWIPSKGNLCEELPGKAIGGDHFSNREKQLPANKKYFEADVNYNCGNRNSDRIVYTTNGEVYLTTDHYKSFQQQ